MQSDRTEAHAKESGRRWAAYASTAELADIKRLAQGDGPIAFDRVRAIVDPRGDLRAVELCEVVGWTPAHDPDVYAAAFVRAATEAFGKRRCSI